MPKQITMKSVHGKTKKNVTNQVLKGTYTSSIINLKKMLISKQKTRR